MNNMELSFEGGFYFFPLTRKDAVAISKDILIKAEQERLAAAEEDAKGGIQYNG